MRKKIGITFTKTNYHNYPAWFTTADLGDAFELVELNFERNNLEDIHGCDGFVLTGGVDVHPDLYEGALQYANSPDDFHLARDRFESQVYIHARNHRLPVLGICRGLQLVNVLEGGRLTQDMDAGNETHKKEDVDKIHAITVEPGSLLGAVSGVAKGTVNSAHHQCIDPRYLAPTLTISATADDGTIEGVEFKEPEGKGFLLCIQWHPERMPDKENSPLSLHIKKAFLNAISRTNMSKLDITNPATGEVIKSLHTDDAQSLTAKLDTLRKGQPAWHAVPLAERVGIIRKFSDIMHRDIETLAATLTSEVGKPLQQARNEVNGARNRIAWLTNNAEKFLSEEVMHEEAGLKEIIRYEPLGVVCNISAWNYPFLVGTNVYVPALLAGNAVFYKPSEYSTLTGLHIERMLKEAGVPDDAFQIAVGGGAVGQILLDLPLDGYFFTGSYKTGKYIYDSVAPKMVPCQCELGGKDPLYVADDVADIASIAAGTADGAFYNNGQSCCSVERIYVHEKVYDKYVEEFVKEVKSWKIGAPTEDGVYIGPLSRAQQVAFLEGQVKDATSKGAKLLTGGKPIAGKGYYFEPTVLVDVDHRMSVMRDESFGPIIGIMKVKDDAEALNLMNDTEYGLTASVYSADRDRAEGILSKLDSGTGYWNCCDRVSASLPWSGRRHSGFGATLSHAGLRAFTHPKAYHLRG